MQAGVFRDRQDGGAQLGAQLASDAGRFDVLVCGLARGGVPVAYEVALRLNAPLDVVVVRKLGAPGQPELAVGALAPDGVRVINEDLVHALGISQASLDAITAREGRELARRERLYRGDRPAPDLHGRTLILVDDGLATGASMEAAVAWARHQQAARVIVAVPVAADSAVARLARTADEVVVVETPPCFEAVGAWYQDFAQTSDEELLTLVNRKGTKINHEGAKTRSESS